MDDCRLCGGKDMELVLDMGEHPIAHHYKEDPAQEEYRHIVGLSFCKQCGHIQLDDPIPAEILYANYICLSSWKFQPHVPQLVNLISRQTSVTKDSLVLEVGSNDGRFLKALEEEGYRNLIGIEPAEDARRSAAEKGVITIPGFFDKQKAWGFVQEHGQCDLFISRQVLEHIKDLNEFMEAMRIVIKPGGLVLIEVPNFMMNLEMFDYTLWEEHVNYFTFDTLNNFFSRTGIVELHREKVVFSGEILVVLGQYIGPEAKETKIDYVAALTKKVEKYKRNWSDFRGRVQTYLLDQRKAGKKIAVYGAGSRTSSFVNFLGLKDYLDCFLDDQVEKQFKYMPGSQLPILPSKALYERSIGVCLLGVNFECEDKVVTNHAEFLRRGGEFYSILPPSHRLPGFWKELLV